MDLQTIKSLQGKEEYVLLPLPIYHSLEEQIIERLQSFEKNPPKYIEFALEDFLENPVTLARIKAHLTQKELADRLGVSQAYISKVEAQKKVSAKTLNKIMEKIKCLTLKDQKSCI